jgi:phosphohistidine phosphatase
MKLHIIRHAKTLQASLNENDFNRRLMERGILQANSLADYLKSKSISCDVWCSEANRTRETLVILNEKCDFQKIEFFNELYLCSKRTFLELLWQDASDEDLIIVGHNFGISDLASYFLNDEIELRTGEYICIDFGKSARNETSNGLGEMTDRWRFEY